MSLNDWIGTCGVALLVLAFALNVSEKLSANSKTYLCLNVAGSGLACVCSYRIGFWPFVVLEFIWLCASLVALLKLKK